MIVVVCRNVVCPISEMIFAGLCPKKAPLSNTPTEPVSEKCVADKMWEHYINAVPWRKGVREDTVVSIHPVLPTISASYRVITVSLAIWQKKKNVVKDGQAAKTAKQMYLLRDTQNGFLALDNRAIVILDDPPLLHKQERTMRSGRPNGCLLEFLLTKDQHPGQG